jgi:hypothetical protein
MAMVYLTLVSSRLEAPIVTVTESRILVTLRVCKALTATSMEFQTSANSIAIKTELPMIATSQMELLTVTQT